MSRLSKNIIYNLLGQGLILVLGFVAVKYVFKQLGEDSLGIIYFALTLSAVLRLTLDVGMGSTTVREVSAYADDGRGYIHDLLRTFSLFYWGGYLLLALAIYWASPLLVTKWINLRSLDPSVAVQALRILGMGTLLALPRSFYVSAVCGIQRMEFNNLIDVTMLALQQLGTIVILIFGGRLLDVAYWLAGCFGLGILAYVCVCARFFSLRALFPGFSSSAVRRNWTFASRAASISILAMVQNQADKAIVSKLLPLGLFGYYSVASTAASRTTLVTSAVAQAAFPSLSTLVKAGDRGSLMAHYRKLQDLLCLGTVPVFAAIPFAAAPLFSYLLNAEAARVLLSPVLFLCVGFYMNGTLNIPYYFSLAVGKPEITARLNFYALFVVLPLTVVLVYFFGLKGAGFSWIVYHLFGYAYAVPRICTECMEIPVAKWYAHIGKILAVASLTYGAGWALLESLGAHSILALALAYLGASFLFAFEAYWLAGDELKGALWRFLQTLRLRAAEIA